MNTIKAGFNLAVDIWSTGNWWARRLLIGVVIWHLTTLAVGLGGVPVVTILFMIMVGSVLAVSAVWYSQPLIPILAVFASPGRTVIHWVTTIIGLELALGVYLATVPVGTNWTTRTLALMAIGAAFTAVILKASHSSWKTLTVVLWLKFIILTAVIYAYGWMPDMVSAGSEAWQKWQGQTAEKIRQGEIIWPISATQTDKKSAQAYKYYPTCPDADRDFGFEPNKTKIKVPLRMDCWSGWVKLPADNFGNRAYRSWYYDSPGEVEFLQGNGQRIHTINQDMFGWWPADNRFRVRGKGPAATIEIAR